MTKRRLGGEWVGLGGSAGLGRGGGGWMAWVRGSVGPWVRGLYISDLNSIKSTSI